MEDLRSSSRLLRFLKSSLGFRSNSLELEDEEHKETFATRMTLTALDEHARNTGTRPSNSQPIITTSDTSKNIYTLRLCYHSGNFGEEMRRYLANASINQYCTVWRRSCTRLGITSESTTSWSTALHIYLVLILALSISITNSRQSSSLFV